ncbi:MAG: NADH-quinone oxidoreductase subunit M [Candidatus Micrarchaeales archaeon]|nr:NADH-quinone oxidoreductase subunit M [Candidatus Micrarchaeales archaeon]
MVPFIGILLALLSFGVVATMFSSEKTSKTLASVFSLLALVVVVAAFFYMAQTGSMNYTENYSYYIMQPSISLGFQFSPISFVLVLMASIVSFVTLLSGNVENESRKISSILILLFELAAIGLFTSGNLFLLFIFWDVGVISLFFMIYILGSSNRRRAAVKFLIYELFASLALLFAIMLVYFYTPLHSFDIQYIIANAGLISLPVQALIFSSFFIAFLINMPVFPVHLWLPDAHTEASTQGSMLLSGILTKFGGYGMILTFFMMPIAAHFEVPIAILAGFSAIYAVFVLMTQHDIKRIIAYSTIVEMGIILVAIASFNQFGISGAAYGMLAHGLTIAMLFLAAGSIGHMFAERDIRNLRGVVRNALSTSYTFLAGVFATTGVPLTAAFIADVLIFIGAIKTFSIYGAIPLAALLLLGAFLYYVVNKSILSTSEYSSNPRFIGRSQKAGYAILLSSIFIFGVLPFLLLNFFSNI